MANKIRVKDGSKAEMAGSYAFSPLSNSQYRSVQYFAYKSIDLPYKRTCMLILLWDLKIPPLSSLLRCSGKYHVPESCSYIFFTLDSQRAAKRPIVQYQSLVLISFFRLSIMKYSGFIILTRSVQMYTENDTQLNESGIIFLLCFIMMQNLVN